MINNYTDIITNIKLKLHILTSVSYITISYYTINLYYYITYTIQHITYNVSTNTLLIHTDTLTLSVNSEQVMKFDNSRSLTKLQFKHIERRVDRIST